MSYIIFARWFGWVSVLLALGILFNLEESKIMAKEIIHTASGYIMGGVLPIIFGILVFILDSHIARNWEGVVSIIGLFMVAVGIFRVVFPRSWRKLMELHLDKIAALFSLFGLMLGLLLLYIGYIAPPVLVYT